MKNLNNRSRITRPESLRNSKKTGASHLVGLAVCLLALTSWMFLPCLASSRSAGSTFAYRTNPSTESGQPGSDVDSTSSAFGQIAPLGLDAWSSSGPAEYASSLAMDPTNPANLFAGTYDSGVFKSTDGGASWGAAGAVGTVVIALAIDPTNQNIIYAGGAGGVFKSIDGGASWSFKGLGGDSVVYALAVDPSNPNNIYESGNHCYECDYNPSSIHKSTDGGETWNEVLSDLSIPRPLALDSNNPLTIYVGDLARIYKSTDGGGSWNSSTQGLPFNFVYALATVPGNPNTIYAGTWGRYPGDTGVFKSTDGGLRWNNVGLTNTTILALAVDPRQTSTIYAGVYGDGVFKSTDGGANWSAFNAGLTNLVVRTLAIDQSGTQLHAATSAGVFDYRYSPGCADSISPTSRSHGSGPESGSIGINAPASCSWTALTSAPWLTVASGSGTGAGILNYSVTHNTTQSQRSATITIAGLTFSVTQAGISCSFSIAPTSQSFGDAGGTDTVSVTEPSGCGWTAASNAGWITIDSGSTGTGEGTVRYSVAPNTTTTTRTGSMTIAGRSFSVTQARAPSSCVTSISPTGSSFSAAGGAASVTVNALSGCNWTAVIDRAWISIVSGASGTGAGTTKYSIAANSSTNPRGGTIIFGGRVLTVSQDAASCTFSLGSTSQAIGTAGGTGSISVTAPSGCMWTAASNDSWITVTSSGAGNGSGTVSYSVSANSVASTRSGTMTIAGQTFTVVQAGVVVGCSFTISPSGQSLSSGGGGGAVSVAAPMGCTWTAISNAGFITITAGVGGTGSGTVTYSVSANTDTASRSGTMTIAAQTFTVNQAGACAFAISPVNRVMAAAGGPATVSVTTTAACNWTAVSNVGWITITSGASGAGNGTVTYNIAARGASSRTGTITIAGLTHTVKQ